MTFRDRRDAGRRLGAALAEAHLVHPLVVGLPRGGVPVAAEVARALAAPLDVLIVRKLGHPSQPELGLGAIGEGGVTVWNDDLIRQLGVRPAELDEIAGRERVELERRVTAYRGGRGRPTVVGRTVVLVDDGLATGFTARAAIEVLRREGAGRIVLTVPVAHPDTITELRTVADEVTALETPDDLGAVGRWFEDFAQVSDAEVTALLER